ncbi:helix-turn-helix domain-containing protein [Methylocapsa sp. S129]|uniref:helix-turn-helix domain-containing protein n=1 Tax=Methylocapsa sp. S129 TaxID=1641869 RepID=UPI00131BF7E6|nr:helix-turn-helix transcriptional regulator [Methylocapsa sp. S129]
MNRPPTDLSAKLDFALKRANMSKGRLAAEAGVDKSAVGRWARGVVAPSEHNLASVTRILARKFSSFNLTSWHMPMEAFVLSLGGPFPPAPPHPGNFLARSLAESAATIEREGRNCLGVYLGFRHGLNMGGRLICDLYVLWREGDALCFKQFGVSFGHGGPAYVLRSQVYLIGDDLDVINSLYFAILIGVVGGRAVRMDGLMLTVAGSHRLNAPSSTTIVMQRIADLPPGDGCPDLAVLDRVLQRVRTAVAGHDFKSLIAPEILAAISAPVGVQHPDGVLEHTLRVAPEPSLSRSEIECDARTARYMKTLREVFLAEDAPLLPMAPVAGAPGLSY